jgi:hypothetical protein
MQGGRTASKEPFRCKNIINERLKKKGYDYEEIELKYISFGQNYLLLISYLYKLRFLLFTTYIL